MARIGFHPDGSISPRPFREGRGISLDEVARHTKISVRFLQAIESAEYDKLPGGIFNTSYLRQYAAAVGYCEASLLDHYAAQSSPREILETEKTEGIFSRWLHLAAHGRS